MNQRVLLTFIIQGLVGCLFTSETASARTWEITVDGLGDAFSIQAGIDSASAGDTVLVYPGTYNEAIKFRGNDVIVCTQSGPQVTVLDGTGLSGRLVTFENGESHSAILEGFTITNSTDGGIRIFNSSPTISGNTITNNGPAPNGGGIWCSADSFEPWFPVIRRNTITNNEGDNLGGGIAFAAWMVPEILDNHISNNKATRGDGGGIYYRSFDSRALIRGNVVAGNLAGDHGGGIYVANISDTTLELEISWNLITSNHAGGRAMTGNSGGGLWLWRTTAWVHHNSFIDNAGDGPDSTYGGGVVVEYAGSPLIEQNIIALMQNGGGIWCGGGATPTIANNLAWQNIGGHGVRDCSDWWQSDGNIAEDPAFCDPDNGDYSVAQNSPAMTHSAGPLGAIPLPGCGPVAVRPTTWGSLKSLYDSGNHR